MKPPEYRRPNPGEYEMPVDGEPTCYIAASGNRNKDRQAAANLLECNYTEVTSLRTGWMVWEPEEAARRYREERCECDAVMKEGYDEDLCQCPWPDIETFWDESGYYCPWTFCRKDTPGAERFMIAEATL